jgi:hypothetical protein
MLDPVRLRALASLGFSIFRSGTRAKVKASDLLLEGVDGCYTALWFTLN